MQIFHNKKLAYSHSSAKRNINDSKRGRLSNILKIFKIHFLIKIMHINHKSYSFYLERNKKGI